MNISLGFGEAVSHNLVTDTFHSMLASSLTYELTYFKVSAPVMGNKTPKHQCALLHSILHRGTLTKV